MKWHNLVTLSTILPCKKKKSLENSTFKIIVHSSLHTEAGYEVPKNPEDHRRWVMSARAMWCLQFLRYLSLHQWSSIGGSCILPVSLPANTVILDKPSSFLCLRLPLIHKLDIPISREKQNLEGMKGVCLTYTSFSKRNHLLCRKTHDYWSLKERQQNTWLTYQCWSHSWVNPRLHLQSVTQRAPACPKALRASGKAQLAPTQLSFLHF